MSEVKVDLKEYQRQHNRYIVVKDFYKIGSAVIGSDGSDSEKFREYMLKCSFIAKSPLQVIRLGGPHPLDAYAEYAPYIIYDDYRDLLEICRSGKCPGKVNPFIKDSPYITLKSDVHSSKSQVSLVVEEA